MSKEGNRLGLHSGIELWQPTTIRLVTFAGQHATTYK